MRRLSNGVAALAATLLIAIAFVLGLLIGPLVSPVAGDPASSQAPESVAPTAAASDPAADYVGSLDMAPARGRIGSQATLRGSGFDPDAQMDVVWQAYEGEWILDDTAPGGENYKGRTYSEVALPLGAVTTDGSGAFSTTFTVPDGFGFTHNIQVLQDGIVRNQTSYFVEMEVTVTPDAGPVGTPITVDVRGIGVSPLHSSWELTYDNTFTGWMSAVTTGGHARFTIPATGAPGPHVLKILHGSFTFPYLNMQQSPDPDRPTFTNIFTVTEGDPVLPSPPAQQWDPVVPGAEPSATGQPQIWTDPVEMSSATR